VVRVVAVNGFDEETLVRDAACVEEHFPHPFAAAIEEEAERRGLIHRGELHGDVDYVVASGVVSSMSAGRFVVGSRAFLAQRGVRIDRGAVREASAGAHSLVYAAVDDRLAGIFAIEDPVREEAMRRVHRNFRAIAGVNSALIALGALGLIPAALSGALHNSTTLLTSARSLRRYLARRA
jgi:cation transport ATPase